MSVLRCDVGAALGNGIRTLEEPFGLRLLAACLASLSLWVSLFGSRNGVEDPIKPP